LPAAAVVLEVTESVIINDLVTARSRLDALKLRGFRLAVDDFGTGHSSLSQLRNFPMDVVKIDKSFVDQITLDHDGTAMVRGVIDLCVALGLTTIAEGVEHECQLALLRQLGCEHVQGYLFAQPMPGAEFAQFLRDFPRIPISSSGFGPWSESDDGR
jgi:EAL domain-containing protein (putative c-di-GMP-specific phosphodiesterase class I)